MSHPLDQMLIIEKLRILSLLVLCLGACPFSGAQQPVVPREVQPEAAKIRTRKLLTAEEFAKHKLEIQEPAIVTQIHPDVPEMVFHLIPDLHKDDPRGGRQHVGRIEISKGRMGAITQVIDVFATASIEFFIKQFEFIDVNHDGYLDIATIAEFGGAKWGRLQYWIYDPKSGLYISNWLTRQLSRFKCNDLCTDPKTKEIHVHYLTHDGVIDERYKIQGRRLVLVSQVELKPKDKTFIATTKRFVNGKAKIIKVEHVNEYPDCDCPLPKRPSTAGEPVAGSSVGRAVE